MPVPEKAFHDIHIRKRISKNKEKYPSRDKLKNLIDKLVYASAVLLPALNTLQIIKIWTNKSALGLSIISWTGFCIFSFIWLIYGIIHKEKSIIMLNIGLITTQMFIIAGIIIYS